MTAKLTSSNPWESELEGAPYDPGANSTEDMEPHITRGDMIEWLDGLQAQSPKSEAVIDAIIAYLKAH